MTLIPKAFARRATALPMRPGPTMPKTLPFRSRPRSRSGAHPANLPVRTIRSPSTTRRARASRRAIVRSAVASVSTLGVWVTTIPCAAAAARSIWFTPDGVARDDLEPVGGRDHGGRDRIVHEADQRVDARDLGRELQLGRVVAQHADLEVRLERVERAPAARASPGSTPPVTGSSAAGPGPRKRWRRRRRAASARGATSWPRKPDEERGARHDEAEKLDCRGSGHTSTRLLRARRDAGDPVSLLDAQDDVHPRDDRPKTV